MIVYGVLDRRIDQIVEFFSSLASAEGFIEECLADEPEWEEILSIEVFEFEMSTN